MNILFAQYPRTYRTTYLTYNKISLYLNSFTTTVSLWFKCGVIFTFFHLFFIILRFFALSINTVWNMPFLSISLFLEAQYRD